MSESIRFNSNLFYDADQKLIKDKKVMIFVTDTNEDNQKDISASNAMIGINLPALGQVTSVSIPFKTREEETNAALLGITPSNWAALCLHVAYDEEAGKDVLKVKRLNGLSVYKMSPVNLCSDRGVV